MKKLKDNLTLIGVIQIESYENIYTIQQTIEGVYIIKLEDERQFDIYFKELHKAIKYVEQMILKNEGFLN